MNEYRDAELNRQLGDWLREEATARAPGRLVEEVFARTSRTRQARRWWPPVWPTRSRDDRMRPEIVGRNGFGRRWLGRFGGLVQVAGFVVVVVAVVAVLAWPRATTPAGSPHPSMSPSGSPASSLETPRAIVLDGSQAQVLSLAADAAPVDVIYAFGSIWVANSQANDVTRFDPRDMGQLATVAAGLGPTWFVEAGGALWVTNEGGFGVVPIDPTTERAAPAVGTAAPCGRPVLALGSIWAAACKADVIMRIDPEKREMIGTIPAAGHTSLVSAGSALIAAGPTGLARLDPETGSFTEVGACCGALLGSDGETVWTSDETKVQRIDPTDGRVIATFSYRYARGLRFASDHAWLTVSNVGAVEINLATNAVMLTIPQWPDPTVPLEAAGAVWLTDKDRNELWRIVP